MTTFFDSRWVDRPAHVTETATTALPAGFRAADWAHLVVSGDGQAVTVTLENSDRNPIADVTLPGAAPSPAPGSTRRRV